MIRMSLIFCNVQIGLVHVATNLCWWFLHLGHSCKFPGCSTVLILDGNMKNRRDICFAKDAGFIEFEGLPGSINTGCHASPAYKSRYCDKHMSLVCDSCHFEEDDTTELDAPVGPILRASQKHKLGESVILKIVTKKQTRKQTYYKVGKLCECFRTHPYVQLLLRTLRLHFSKSAKFSTR